MSAISSTAFQARQTETQFHNTVVEAARRFGWLDIHYPSMVANPTDFPGLILLHGGTCLFVELKREYGRMGRCQLQRAIDLEAAGFPVRVWKPSDWPIIEKTLKGYS